MKGTWIRYSAEERAWIEERQTWSRAELHAAFRLAFGRDEVTHDNIKSYCTRMGYRTGRNGRFAAGIVPHNKGQKMPFNPNSARTQFKKGDLPHNTREIGAERLSKDGYVEISVAERNPYTGAARRFVLKHKYLWEQANGPLPKGMCLKCRGDKSNTDPANWEMVPRALLPRLNGGHGRQYDGAPAEVKPTIMAIAKLAHRARTARKGDRA